MNKTRNHPIKGLAIAIALMSLSVIASAHEFEKGDAVVKDMEWFEVAMWLFGSPTLGHIGMYGEFVGVPPVDPFDQNLVEMTGPISNFSATSTLYDWYRSVGQQNVWGVKTFAGLDWDDRQLLVDTARGFTNARYAFRSDYKRPLLSPPLFRCDGLIEYVYEVILGEEWRPADEPPYTNGGLVSNDVWGSLAFGSSTTVTLSPERMWNSTRWMTRISGVPPTMTITDANSNPVTGGFINSNSVSVYATDTNSGSGLSLLQIWQGNPDAGGSLLTSFSQDYDVDHTYSYSDIGTLPQGLITVRAYDQAGNMTSGGFTVDTTPPSLEAGGQTPGSGNTSSLSQPTVCASFNEPVNLIEFKVDGNDVTSQSSTSGNRVCYTPGSDLSNSSHAIYVKVRDLAGNETTTTWSFDVEAAPSDLEIRNLRATDIQTNQATIEWETYRGTTSVSTTGNVEYGLTTNLGWGTSDSQRSAHSVTLTALEEDTLYYYRAISADGSTTAVSGMQTFRTLGPDEAPLHLELSARATEQYDTQVPLPGSSTFASAHLECYVDHNTNIMYGEAVDIVAAYAHGAEATVVLAPTKINGECCIWGNQEYRINGSGGEVGNNNNSDPKTVSHTIGLSAGANHVNFDAWTHLVSYVDFGYWAQVFVPTPTYDSSFSSQSVSGVGTMTAGQASTGTVSLTFNPPHNGTVTGAYDIQLTASEDVSLVVVSTSLSGNTLIVAYQATSNESTAPPAPPPPTANGSSEPPPTTSPTATVAWTAPSDPSGVRGVFYKVGSVPTSDTDGTFTTASSFTVTLPQASGTYPIYVWAQDNLANASHLNRSTVTIALDLTPPAAANLSPSLLVFSPNFDGNLDSTVLSYDLSDNVSSTSTVSIDVLTSTGASVRTLLSNVVQANGPQSVAWDGLNAGSQPVAEGVYVFRVVSKDGLNNVSTATVEAAVQYPKPTVLFPVAGQTYTDPRLSVLGTSEPDAGIKIYEGLTLLGQGAANSLGNFVVQPTTEFSAGTHTVTARSYGPTGVLSGTGDPVTFYINVSSLPAAPDPAKLSVTFNASPSSDTLTGAAGAVLGNATVQMYTDPGLTNLARQVLAAGDGAFGPVQMGDNAFEEVYVVQIASGEAGPSTKVLLDQAAPSAVADLSALAISAGTVKLTWTAAGDSGGSGTASTYTIKTATYALTEQNFGGVAALDGAPAPLAAGSAQSVVAAGLSGGATYYFALKTTDDAGNASGLSNVVSAYVAGGPSVAVGQVAHLVTGGAGQITVTYLEPSTTTVNENNLGLYYFDPTTGQLIQLTGTVDTNNNTIIVNTGQGGFPTDGNGYFVVKQSTDTLPPQALSSPGFFIPAAAILIGGERSGSTNFGAELALGQAATSSGTLTSTNYLVQLGLYEAAQTQWQSTATVNGSPELTLVTSMGGMNAGPALEPILSQSLARAWSVNGLTSLGNIYDIGPSGITFNPPATAVFRYAPDEGETGFRIHRYDGAAWQALANQVQNTSSNTLTAPLWAGGALGLFRTDRAVVINEVAPSEAGGNDLVEFYVLNSTGLGGWKFYEDETLVKTFPQTGVWAGNIPQNTYITLRFNDATADQVTLSTAGRINIYTTDPGLSEGDNVLMLSDAAGLAFAGGRISSGTVKDFLAYADQDTTELTDSLTGKMLSSTSAAQDQWFFAGTVPRQFDAVNSRGLIQPGRGLARGTDSWKSRPPSKYDWSYRTSLSTGSANSPHSATAGVGAAQIAGVNGSTYTLAGATGTWTISYYVPAPTNSNEGHMLALDIPPGWTAPQASSNTEPGYVKVLAPALSTPTYNVSVATGIPNTSGRVILPLGALMGGTTVQVVYGSTETSANGAATAQTSTGTVVFYVWVDETGSNVGPIAGPPGVTVGSGGMGALRVAVLGPDPAFKLGEVYAFPNPAKKGKKPILHVEVGVADTVQLRFYDVAGDLVHETELSGNPLIIDDGQGPQYAYEYPWDGHIPSGTYIYVMRAKKVGHEDLEKISKLAVIR